MEKCYWMAVAILMGLTVRWTVSLILTQALGSHRSLGIMKPSDTGRKSP